MEVPTRQTLTPDGGFGGLLGLRGSRVHKKQAARGRGRVRPRRYDHVNPSPTTRCDRAVTSPRLASPTWSPTGWRPASDFPTFPASAGGETFLEAKDGGAGPGISCWPTTTGWSTSGAADSDGRLRPSLHHSLVGRRVWRLPRCGATGPEAFGPSASARSRPIWDYPASTAEPGIPSSPPARRPGTVVCMHIGSSSKMPATSAGHRAGCRGGDAQLRQRHVLSV